MRGEPSSLITITHHSRMTFTTQCPACGAAARLADHAAGDEVRCGRCGTDYAAEPPATADRPRRRRPDDDGGRAVAALVLGVVAVVTWPCPPAGLIAGGLAVLAGVAGLAARQRSLAVAGIVLGLSGVVFSLGCGVLYGVAIDQEERANDSGGNRPPFAH
jgi:predicted Zn finger-like uncharacterized protein